MTGLLAPQFTLAGAERTYGSMKLDGGAWVIDCEPHVGMYLKRFFDRLKNVRGGLLTIENTPAVCRDLEWLLQRFPLNVDDKDALAKGSRQHREKILRLNQILDPSYKPQAFKLAKPLRDYQARAAELFLASKEILIADEVGLGKTAMSIGALTHPETLPAAVVCKPHLAKQWKDEFAKFAPDMNVHIVQKTIPYAVSRTIDGRQTDVFIVSYSKLVGWTQALSKVCKSVVFDEVQEVSRAESQKFEAAKALAASVEYRCGTSATPIRNYGGEIYNVYSILAPGRLGSEAEFEREWTDWGGRHRTLKDPQAFGSWLREQHLMIRRTRREVGRELPPLTKVIHQVDADQSELDKVQDAAGELARIILGATGEKLAKGAAFEAGGEFDRLMRQATGIAKAPYAAAFIEMLLENGEPVLVFAWHRAVYDILLQKLAKYHPAMYTGSESVAEKDEAKDKFVKGETDVLLMSLRSGAGIDGIQHRCRTVVFAELDWSPAAHEQAVGRVFRDGQTDPVTAYFLVAEQGADPVISRVLGLKKEQIEGLTDPHGKGLERLEGGADLKALARAVLDRRPSIMPITRFEGP